MKLYNSLTKTLEEFKPIDSNKIRMYSCGPTVYNNLHIGNLSAFIYADLLRSVLSKSHHDVSAVMNITDVDDKTIAASKRDYPELEPKEGLKQLTQKYEKVFKEDIERIGVWTEKLTFINATDTIAEMIELTQSLLDKGFAYPSDDGIYFSIKNYEEAGYTYGQLQQIDRSHEQARISNDEYDKESASDFALWKRAGDGEPSWEAVFTTARDSIDMPGRPGWHIECSAMSHKLLGEPFDIHTGGIDLKFPHHENEIAQTTAATGNKVMANYFVHNNHVLIDGRKMSKSLGNVITLREIEEKGFAPLAFRLLVLSSHYRSESNFSWDILEAAQNRTTNWRNMFNRRLQQEIFSDNERDITNEIVEILQNDLDTPKVLAYIDEYFDEVDKNGNMPSRETLITIRDLLGLDLLDYDITDEQKQTIKDREQARIAKDWLKSDELRAELEQQGITVSDRSNGTAWSRV